MKVSEMEFYVLQYSGCKITYFLSCANGQKKFNLMAKPAKDPWDLFHLSSILCCTTDWSKIMVKSLLRYSVYTCRYKCCPRQALLTWRTWHGLYTVHVFQQHIKVVGENFMCTKPHLGKNFVIHFLSLIIIIVILKQCIRSIISTN